MLLHRQRPSISSTLDLWRKGLRAPSLAPSSGGVARWDLRKTEKV